MESKKKKQIGVAEQVLDLRYPVKKGSTVNMCSAGAVALEDARRMGLQE